MTMKETTTNERIQEIDKRLSSHESACDIRWKENYRRLSSIETQLTTLNTQIRVALAALVSSMAAMMISYFT
jgi:hypothetical protein